MVSLGTRPNRKQIHRQHFSGHNHVDTFQAGASRAYKYGVRSRTLSMRFSTMLSLLNTSATSENCVICALMLCFILFFFPVV